MRAIVTLKLDKVLLVEDELEVAAFIYRAYEGDWKVIDHAKSEDEAVELIDRTKNNYDIILLDAHLGVGERTREKALATVKTIRSASNAPIALHTGDTVLADEMEDEGPAIGVFGVIRKGSFTKHHVATVIEKAILKWQMARVNLALEVHREEKTRFRRDYLGRK